MSELAARFHTPPENQGQIIDVSYAAIGAYVVRLTYDSRDQTRRYALSTRLNDDEGEYRNGAPANRDWREISAAGVDWLLEDGLNQHDPDGSDARLVYGIGDWGSETVTYEENARLTAALREYITRELPEYRWHILALGPDDMNMDNDPPIVHLPEYVQDTIQSAWEHALAVVFENETTS